MRLLLVLRILLRLSIVTQLVLGILFWTGHAYPLLPLHMAVGLVFVLSLWALTGLAAKRGAPLPAVLTGVVLGLAVLGLGGMQTQLLPGDYHWVIRVLHLLLGMGTMGFAESLAKRIAAAPAARAAA